MNKPRQKGSASQQPLRSLEQAAFLGLLRTADQLGRDFELLFKQQQLSATQYNVLRILRAAGEAGLPCSQIGQRMITQDPDITRLLDRLEAQELIVRCRQTEDRRVVRARISQAGLELLAGLDEPVRQLHRTQLVHVPRRKLRLLIELLELVRSRAKS